MATEELHYINALIRTLQKFSQFDSKMQVSTILTLLEIAKAEATKKSISTSEIEKNVGLLSGTSTRNIYYWGEGHPDMRGGHKLVDVGFDINDRRRRTLTLTPKGKTFVAQLIEGMKTDGAAKG